MAGLQAENISAFVSIVPSMPYPDWEASVELPALLIDAWKGTSTLALALPAGV